MVKYSCCICNLDHYISNDTIKGDNDKIMICFHFRKPQNSKDNMPLKKIQWFLKISY